MVDSSDIIDKLFQRIHPDNSAPGSDEEREWRGRVDNHLVHVLSSNITTESDDDFSFTEGLVGATAMYFVSKKLKTKHQIAGATAVYFLAKNLKKKDNSTDLHASFYEAAETWVGCFKGPAISWSAELTVAQNQI